MVSYQRGHDQLCWCRTVERSKKKIAFVTNGVVSSSIMHARSYKLAAKFANPHQLPPLCCFSLTIPPYTNLSLPLSLSLPSFCLRLHGMTEYYLFSPLIVDGKMLSSSNKRGSTLIKCSNLLSSPLLWRQPRQD